MDAHTGSRLDGLLVDELASDAGDDAPVVVLVHGTMDRHSSFARLRSRLMATCRVVSYDRRGYAGSRAAEPPASSITDHVADLEAVIAGRRCTLLGHSYGGSVVLALAAQRPDLTGAAVVYEPPLPWLDWWPRTDPSDGPVFDGSDPRAAAEEFLARTIGRHRYERLPLKTREEVVLDGDALVAEMRAIQRDPAPFEPAAITRPVLVVRGSDTSERHRLGTDWLAARLPAASLHTLGGAGHGGHQSHPAELARIVAAAVTLASDPVADRPPETL